MVDIVIDYDGNIGPIGEYSITVSRVVGLGLGALGLMPLGGKDSITVVETYTPRVVGDSIVYTVDTAEPVDYTVERDNWPIVVSGTAA